MNTGRLEMEEVVTPEDDPLPPVDEDPAGIPLLPLPLPLPAPLLWWWL
jgi:hypothetical protein